MFYFAEDHGRYIFIEEFKGGWRCNLKALMALSFPYLGINGMVSCLAELKQASCCGQVVGLVGEGK